MKKKLLIALVPLLVGGLVAFKMLGPTPEAPKTKVDGEVYVLAKDFLINLQNERFAKLSVALVVEQGGVAEAGGEGEEGGAEPPEGYGVLPQEALVRTIVTDAITGQPAWRLTREKARAALKEHIREQLERRTDVPATAVLFPDLAVQ